MENNGFIADGMKDDSLQTNGYTCHAPTDTTKMNGQISEHTTLPVKTYENHISEPNGMVSHNLQTKEGKMNNANDATGVDKDLAYLDDFEKKKKARRDQDPLKFCSFIVNNPKLAFAVTLGGHGFLVLLSLILLLAGYNLFPAEFIIMPLDINGNERLRWLAWESRNSNTSVIKRFTWDTIMPDWPRGGVEDTLELFYIARGDNIFTRDNLLIMEDIENRIFNATDFQEKYCQLGPGRVCIKPFSILRYFDGTYRSLDEGFYDPEFNNITGVLYLASIHPQTLENFIFFMAHDTQINGKVAKSKQTRSVITIGRPLRQNVSDDDLYEHIRDYLLATFNPILTEMQEKHKEHVELVHYSMYMFVPQSRWQVFRDMILIAGSLVFIYLFILVQTRSFWVTSWAVLSVFTSFLATCIIYRIVFDYRYFGYYHIITIFLILGIGADDFFVFFNTWEANKIYKYKSIAHRMSDTYRRASGTMFYTSLTTSAAFLTNAISPLLAIYSMGIFAATLIAINYISVITFFPTVVYTWHVFFESKPCCCGCCKCCRNNKHEEEESSEIKEVNTEKQHPVTKFFKGPYFRFITHPIARWIILAMYTLLFGFFLYWLTRLRPSAETMQIWTQNTNYARANHLVNRVFIPASDDLLEVYIVWGIKPRDMSRCHHSDVHCYGDQVWDEKFDLNTPPVQFALLDLCRRLHNLSNEEIDKLRIRRDPVTDQLQISCFMEHLEKYMQELQNFTLPELPELPDLPASMQLNKEVNIGKMEFPLSQGNVRPFMEEQPFFYNMSTITKSFYRYFEIMISHWLTNSYTMMSTDEYRTFNPLIGEEPDGSNTQKVVWMDQLIPDFKPASYYGTKLKYAAIRVNLTLSYIGLGYSEALPVIEDWDKFVDKQDAL
ncbi:unnamed protein product [Owenia fusiformis]|uniref:SSD domain-containing protein n=1 Tax=Owenia fusiformis TaxID=6347 RepID=A0A8S4PFN2_OWEFU|nr:unnamed protein product [Owenia fusiformis]